MKHDESHSMRWATGNCHVDGVDIHYIRTGGDLPPLVALHGLLGSGACLAPLARSLESSFDVVLLDARGHGKSSAPSKGYLYSDLAGDVAGLVKELKLQAPILLGHSMGGMTAAVAAANLGPSIAGLVLVDPTFISPEWQREVFESDIAGDHRRSLMSERAELLAQARLRHPARSAEVQECLVDARLQTSLSAFEVLTPPNPDYCELVKHISAPILLVIGDRGVVSLETAGKLRALNPLLRYETIADVGHGIPYDKPAQLGAAILPFLRMVSESWNRAAAED